jgi:hypothetical protein
MSKPKIFTLHDMQIYCMICNLSFKINLQCLKRHVKSILSLPWTYFRQHFHNSDFHCFGQGFARSHLVRSRVRVTNSFVLATSPLRRTTSNFIFQPNTCLHSPYVTSSLTRGWVCRLHLLLALAIAAILRSQSRGTIATFYCLRFWRAKSPYLYIPQEQGGPVISTGTGFPFRLPLRLAGLQWRYSTPPPHVISVLVFFFYYYFC